MKLKFARRPFSIFLSIFIIEILIALYVHDSIIRPYLGDTLVVIMIYYFVKSFFNVKPRIAIIGVTFFAFTIELLQYFNLIGLLGLEQSQFWKIVIGTSFHWLDLVAYLFAAVILWSLEVINLKRNQQ